MISDEVLPPHGSNDFGGDIYESHADLAAEAFESYDEDLGQRDSLDWSSDADGGNTGAECSLAQCDQMGDQSPLKRPAQGISSFRPFKRQKGAPNPEYLDLLNRDIDDAAHRVCLDEEVELSSSQVGLIMWSSIEKRQFFEAVSRLGKYDLPGIAARIGTKSEIEVQQLLNLLQESVEERRDKSCRSYLEFAEYPAAVEMSQQCCHAQEEAADAISVRQECREEQREEHKWGANWDVTRSVAGKLGRDVRNGVSAPDATPPKFAQLFHLTTWLSLSERAFMNSSIPGNNWNYVDDKHPSVWATAFDDFYSLAVSITRRLVQSTLFISQSRIRAKRELHPTTRKVVRRNDVEAAIASLNLPLNCREAWRTSARRLRLDIFEEPPDKDDEEAEQEPMTYDEVEEELAFEPKTGEARTASRDGLRLSVQEDDDSTGAAEEDSERVRDRGIESETGVQPNAQDDEEAFEINQDLKEVLWYSLANIRDVRSAKAALRLRIAMERHQEAQAEMHDDYAAHQAEGLMWDMLQRKPPMERPRVQDPGRVQRSNLEVESVYPLGRHWATKLNYYEEWETMDTNQDDECEDDL